MKNLDEFLKLSGIELLPFQREFLNQIINQKEIYICCPPNIGRTNFRLMQGGNMMSNKIREIFCPTPEEEIKSLEKLIALHKEQIGQCCTCEHYVPSTEPGFVTDYGTCRAKSVIFSKKVCDIKEIGCFYFSENTERIKRLEERIAELKGE